MARKLLLRLVVIAAVVGGVFYWQRSRKPADMTLAIDLQGAKPHEMTGIDVILRRDGKLLARHEMTFGPAGAPATVEFVVHAAPGTAEIESTANYQNKPSRRVKVKKDLTAEGSNAIRIE